ncbi:hypothetical protein OsI_32831 [Oryza sativa Indica Group]|uniref:Uncharacterized protein n=1 Tax=Oryza sativa subsp. indica TaxID=39946 RepID=B8BFU5_ORYSI|nr:hypothetical protein OsI_32831 [Oryza sativa Indica Group]
MAVSGAVASWNGGAGAEKGRVGRREEVEARHLAMAAMVVVHDGLARLRSKSGSEKDDMDRVDKQRFRVLAASASPGDGLERGGPAVCGVQDRHAADEARGGRPRLTTVPIQPARPGSGAALPVGGGDAALQIGDGGEAESTATAPQCPTRWSQVAAVHCGVTALVRDRVQRAGGQEGTVGPA